MITLRKSADRGHAEHGWLDTYHTFSFADYYDPQHMGFAHLRVINEDRVEPNNGFGLHPHKDMEIVTYVISGALDHKDSMGNSSTLRAREVQRMTAGTGVRHSEVNSSLTDTVHLLQIWILPEKQGLAPGYEQKNFATSEPNTLLVSPEGRDGSLKIHQRVEIRRLNLPAAGTLTLPLRNGSKAWVQDISGKLTLNETALASGDGAAVEAETTLSFSAKEPSELLVFEMWG